VHVRLLHQPGDLVDAGADVPEGVEEGDVDAPVDAFALHRRVDDVDAFVEAVEHAGEAGHDELEIVGERDANRARSVHASMFVPTAQCRNTLRGEATKRIRRHSAAVELEGVRCSVPFAALDLASVDDFRCWVYDRIATGEPEAARAAFILDLGEVEFVMAAGVQALVELDAELNRVGRTLAVTGAAPIVARVLDICGCADRLILP